MARPQKISDAQILEIARGLWVARGAAAPLAEVAAQLGVSQAALLHRVGSKEALLRRALDPGPPEAAAWLTKEPGAEAVAAQLSVILLSLAAFLARALPALLVLREAGIPLEKAPSPSAYTPAGLRRLLVAWLRKVAPRFRRPIAPVMLAEALLGVLEARACHRHLSGEPFLPSAEEDFVESLLAAFVPEERD